MPFVTGGSINILSDLCIGVFFLQPQKYEEERERVYTYTLSGHTDGMQPKLNAIEHPSYQDGPTHSNIIKNVQMYL